MKFLPAVLLCLGTFTPLNAAVTGYWRFESGALLEDSGPNNLDLATGGAGVPTQVARPGTGNGSAYPATVDGNSNGSAASFGGSGRFTVPDNALFTDNTFSAEAFITTANTGTNTEAIVGHWNGNTTGPIDQRSWLFTISGTNVLTFLYSTTGANTVTVSSGLPALALNTDYYVGVTVDMADSSAAGITFYLQDLTNGGAMQIASVAHTAATLFNSNQPLTIGATAQPSSTWNGLIDEVRISDTKLTGDQLLMPVPEPSAIALAGLALGALGMRRRRH